MNLSLGQVMKAVAYCAAAFGTVAPIFRHWQSGSINNGQPEGLIYVAIFAGVAVPLAWALLTFLLIRGTRRDEAISALLLASLAVAESFAGFLLVVVGVPALWNLSPRDAASTMAGYALVNLALAAGIAFLVFRLRQSSRARRIARLTPAGLPGESPRPGPAP